MSASRRQAFETLGLPYNADAQAIRKAFRTLSRTHHPDLGGDPATYQAITTAYTVLTDPAAAAQADAAAARAATAQPPAQRPMQPSQRNPRTTSGATSGTRYTPSGPASQDVTYDGAHASLSERDAHTLVRGSIRRRGLLDRSVYREARTAAVTDLFERIHEHVPAARMVLGVRIDSTDIEAVIFAGQRSLRWTSRSPWTPNTRGTEPSYAPTGRRWRTTQTTMRYMRWNAGSAARELKRCTCCSRRGVRLSIRS
ncbi:J domain-containing protein [Pseudoglutamicibacter cumminsii]|uniref:J domain-containing protein n=1 Tax=Pseudoglutamicibacter cumminsii TaxID=156979 RepID=UPI002ABC9054|nr:J domain-containing protein [Pseudoglutamicibacter cumminsii]MDZ3745360.1 J domain-containing protein [Pseudoglutamicibacter cumminsii]